MSSSNEKNEKGEKKFHNDNERISASEINKFLFCNYSWYYVRVYGSQNLRNMQSTKKTKKITNYQKSLSHLKRGREFHNTFLENIEKMTKRKRLLTLGIWAIIITILFIIYKLIWKIQ